MSTYFKTIVSVFAFLAVLFHSVLAMEESGNFLLPKDEEDPLKLKPFLNEHYTPGKLLYEEIQKAKASADIEQILKLKEEFETSKAPEKGWEDLVVQLKEQVNGNLIDLWPDQTPQQCIGSVLFYPQELICNPLGDETVFYYPGLMASLAISACYGNPLAIYELSTGYSTLANQSRRPPYDSSEYEKIGSEDEEISTSLHKKALQLFEKAQGNKVAQFYLAKNEYYPGEKSEISYIGKIENLDLPESYFELGRVYENCTPSDSQNKQNEEKALQYYQLALSKGFENAIWGIYRLSSGGGGCQNLEELSHAQKRYCVFLDQKTSSKRRKVSKETYEESGKMGHLQSYMTLGKEILFQHIPAENPKELAITSYRQADRFGYAMGGRELIRNTILESSEQAPFILEMVKLKDIKGHEKFLTCYDVEGYQLSTQQYSKEEIEKDYTRILQERAKVIEIIKNTTDVK